MPDLPNTKKSAPLSAKIPFTAKAWSVQLGTFMDKKQAKQLQEKLLKAGYSAYIVAAEHGAKKGTQVLIGPELEKERANQIKATLQAKFAIKGTIVDYNPVAG